MTISEVDSDATASTASEVAWATIDDPGVYIFSIDTQVMVLGDKIEIRIYKKVQSDESRYLYLKRTFAHVQGDGAADTAGDGEVIKDSIPIPSPHSFRVTVIRVGGSDRTYEWAIYAL